MAALPAFRLRMLLKTLLVDFFLRYGQKFLDRGVPLDNPIGPVLAQQPHTP